MKIEEILQLDLPALKVAYAIAAEIHKDQKRSSSLPYMTHIDAVIENSFKFCDVESDNQLLQKSLLRELDVILVVAALHDTLEDHPDKISIKTIEKKLAPCFLGEMSIYFGLVLGSIVAITKLPKGEETYDSYVRRVKKYFYSTLVKKADLLHNMSDLKPGNMLDKYQLTYAVLDGKI